MKIFEYHDRKFLASKKYIFRGLWASGLWARARAMSAARGMSAWFPPPGILVKKYFFLSLSERGVGVAQKIETAIVFFRSMASGKNVQPIEKRFTRRFRR